MCRMIRPAVCVTILTVLAASAAMPVFAADWNDDEIRWRPYEDALVEAKESHKPLCLVVYTNWCVHCKNYSRVFHVREVVEASRGFVMVRANADYEPSLSRKYAIDGSYIPRTFFLRPDGTPATRIHAPRDRYRYFYDENDPASLLAGMRAARNLAR